MSATGVQPIGLERPDQPAPPAAPKRQVRRQKATTESSETACRFFLAKPGAGDSVVLGREFIKEGEALFEAFKSGTTLYTVTEWRPVADFSGKTPRLRKETILPKRP
jgi:hypothetical protein